MNKDALNFRIFKIPLSGIRQNNTKINYFDFISSLNNKNCNDALLRIVPRINMAEIYHIIDTTPLITELQSKFYKTILAARKEKILDFSFHKLQQK